MASTFHLGAYHELADTFTLGFEKRRKKKKKRESRGEEREKKRAEFLSFFYELPSFFSLPSPHRKGDVTFAEISPPDGQRLYKQPSPVQGAFD